MGKSVSFWTGQGPGPGTGRFGPDGQELPGRAPGAERTFLFFGHLGVCPRGTCPMLFQGSFFPKIPSKRRETGRFAKRTVVEKNGESHLRFRCVCIPKVGLV